MSITKLTLKDRADLHRLKEQARLGFAAMNAACAEIVHRRLYELEYPTWQEFFAKNFGWGERRVYESIQHSKLYESEKLLVDMGQKTEAQAPILKADTLPQARQAVKLSNEATRQAIVTAAPEHSKDDKETLIDETGWEIPEKLVPLWQRREEPRNIYLSIQKLRTQIAKAHESGDVLYANGNAQQAASELSVAIGCLKALVPYAVCPWCQGKLTATCQACKGSGLINKEIWNTAVPKEMKDIRERSKK